ncbi:hypothetical protein [Streptomyces sp. NPDC002845]
MNLPVQHTGGPLEQRRRPGGGLWDWNPFTEFENLWRDMGQARGVTPAVWGTGSWVPGRGPCRVASAGGRRRRPEGVGAMPTRPMDRRLPSGWTRAGL